MSGRLKTLCKAVQDRDPAAGSKWEILFCYPTVWALFLHGISHYLWGKNHRIVSRLLSNFVRFTTGVEIHPGAQIGEGAFIDHGMGVVIGETARIGDNVTIYHGVTLGGVMPAVDSAEQRNILRHPEIQEGVIIGSGAQVLGNIVVGKYARIGANAVVTKDVSAGAVMTGIPAREGNKTSGRQEIFTPYGLVADCQHDGYACDKKRLDHQDARIEELERQLEKVLEKGEKT